jgi:hypothetical protein
MKSLRWIAIALALATPSAFADDKDASKDASKMKSNIQSADGSVDAASDALESIYEMPAGAEIDRETAKTASKLAKQGVDVAIEKLEGMKGGKPEAQADASSALTTLKDARTKIAALDKEIGKKGEGERIRTDAREIHSKLDQADDAIDRVKTAYGVTD